MYVWGREEEVEGRGRGRGGGGRGEGEGEGRLVVHTSAGNWIQMHDAITSTLNDTPVVAPA